MPLFSPMQIVGFPMRRLIKIIPTTPFVHLDWFHRFDFNFTNLVFPASIPAAHLTSNWNFPEISWVSSTPELSDKNRFGTFVRTLGPYSKIGIAFQAVFERFKWRRVGIMHADEGMCVCGVYFCCNLLWVHDKQLMSCRSVVPVSRF